MPPRPLSQANLQASTHAHFHAHSHAPRDSLELGSLASSTPSPSPHRDLTHDSAHNSGSSSPSGAPSSRRLSFDDEDPLNPNGLIKDDDDRRSSTDVSNPRYHNRSYSVSSAFDFAAPLFPLSASAPGYTSIGNPSTPSLERGFDHHNPGGSGGPGGAAGGLERQKSLTYLNGLSLVVGLIIGSGIFSSPSQVNKNAGSPGASLLVWVIAGLLAWTGAASYAELGGAIPLNGGAQVYIAKIFGPCFGFLYSWTTVCVLKPGSAAIIAIIFGEYIVRAVIGAEAADASTWVNKGVAVAGVVLVTALNSVSTKIAARSADAFMVFKFVGIVGVAVLGVIVAVTGLSYKGEASTDWKMKGWFDGTSSDMSKWAVAIYAGLWAFDGWDNVNFVTAELSHPSLLPRIIHTSLPIVIISYLLANTSYFLTLPLSVTSTSTTIAVAFGSRVLGPIGSLILALIVSGSCFGALNATIFTSSRLFYSAAREGYLPKVIGTLGLGWEGSRGIRLPTGSTSHARTGHSLTSRAFLARLCADTSPSTSYGTLFYTPIPSLLLNLVLTVIYILLGTFEILLTFYGVAGYLFYFLAVLGLLVLRVREPLLERPYKCWVVTPICFCCVSLFLLSRSVVAAPVVSGAVVPFLAVGGIVYYARVRGRLVGVQSGKAGASRRGGRGVKARRKGGEEGRVRVDDGSGGWKFWKRWR